MRNQSPKNLIIIVAALFAAIFVAAPAIAATVGSSAVAITQLDLRFGPGAKYQNVSTLALGTDVRVERCQNRWCLISNGAQRGWVSIDDLAFGAAERGPATGPKLDRVSGGTGIICFHTGLAYTGQSVCSKTGMVVPDLALYGFDNVFASISVEGSISAHVCREFNFGSYCESVSKSQPKLNKFLSRAISSYRVW